MNKYFKGILIFLLGAGVGVEVYRKLLIKHLRSRNKTPEDTYASVFKDLHEDIISHDVEYYGYDDNKEMGAVDVSNSESILGQTSDNSWSSDSREYVSKIVHSEEYVSKDEANKTVEGEIHVVDEKDLKSNIPIDKNEETVTEDLVSISSLEFVKAVAKGNTMRSFIFNTFDKQLYWNFTEQQISREEAYEYFGKQNIDDLYLESSHNANGWIQPRYFYNPNEDCYIKIESSTFVHILN